MEYEKKHLDKLLALVEEIYKDSDNKEFAAGLNALTLTSNKGAVRLPVYPSEKLDDIYEYCISLKLKQQAEGFYKGFPMINIKDELVTDFVMMEEYRRRDNFSYYCLLMFRQIENIINVVCQDPVFDKMVKGMYPKVLYNDYTLLSYVYGVDDKGKEQSSKPLIEQHVAYRFNVFAIFVLMNYDGRRFNTNLYKKYKNLFYELSQIRNSIHGGTKETPTQKQTRENVTNDRYNYYLKFSALLSDVISIVKDNYPLSTEIYNLAP